MRTKAIDEQQNRTQIAPQPIFAASLTLEKLQVKSLDGILGTHRLSVATSYPGRRPRLNASSVRRKRRLSDIGHHEPRARDIQGP